MSYPQTIFPQTNLHPGSLVARRRAAVASNTLKYQLDVLKQTGRYDAFKLQWHPSYNDEPNVWPIPNHLFWDSDIAKWIEGACYFLRQGYDKIIDHAVNELVEMIRHAQQPDGYIKYNCGHLIEAALAHEEYFNNGRLLAPILRYVDLLCTTFGNGNGQIPGYPGHPEIELALLRLYGRTNDKKHLRLARFFLTERGNPTGWQGRHYFDEETERRGDDPHQQPSFYPKKRSLWYHQAHVPIAEQQEIEGHAVRAMYLLTAAADLIRLEPDTVDANFSAAVFRLWDNMVSKKMYVTGGIGAIKQWEGFGRNYYLPQSTDEGGCYSETCAAIGVMMFANRLLQLKLDGAFTDVMELSLYNAVLTAMSFDGKQFTYVNQLASSDEDPSHREEWFTCACCPPNILRLLGQIGGYIWTHHYELKSQSIVILVHLYISGTMSFDIDGEKIQLEQRSNWPWDGNIHFELKTALRNVRMKLRIPGWASSFEISNGAPTHTVKDGYIELASEWLSSNPSFDLSIPLESRLISPHPLTNQRTRSLVRGPIVYCVEEVDNSWVKDHFKAVQLNKHCTIREQENVDKSSGDKYIGLTITEGASKIEPNNSPNMPWTDTTCEESVPVPELHFIPYYFRANRPGGNGQMRVGLRSS